MSSLLGSSCCCIVLQDTDESAETTPSPFNDFSIDFYVFINDEPCKLYPTIVRPRCLLIDSDDATSWLTMSTILSQMKVPFRARLFMIQEFLTRARQIASRPQNLNRKTIHLVVRLSDEPIDELHDHDDHPVLRLMDRVQMDCKETCSICLEECGKAVQLRACKHIFHENCIFKWFDKNYFCPLCRRNIYAF